MIIQRHPTFDIHEHTAKRKHLFIRPDIIEDPLYVVTTVFNATRYRSRWKLYEDFQKHVYEAGAKLITVEIAFGDREFTVTQPNDIYDVQLRTQTEIWFKENAINIGAQRAAQLGAKYIAWIDADTHFARNDWANETVHQLQHFNFIQMWSQYQDLSPCHEILGTANSFGDNYIKHGYKKPVDGCYPYGHAGYPGAPGLAWACRRDAWDEVGGLIDFCILGACDWWMAHGLIGKVDEIMHMDYHSRYIALIKEWEYRCNRLHKNSKLGILGVMQGLALHYWHGSKKYRKYGTRDRILVRSDFNPDVDLKRDMQGLYQLTDRAPEMRDAIRIYFRERNEDSIDV